MDVINPIRGILANTERFSYKRISSLLKWIVLALMLVLLTIQTGIPQTNSVDRNIGNDFWEIGLDAGLTTFFGDIDEGVANDEYFKNNFAFKLHISRNFKSLISFNGQMSIGRLSGDKKRTSNGVTHETYFINNFNEYTFTAGINLMALIKRNVNTKLGIYAQSGFGLIDFKTKLYNGANDSVVKSLGYDNQESTTELVIPLEIKITYNIGEHSIISVQSVLNRVDTDKLDATEGNDNRDYYNLLSLGYSYKIYPNKKRSLTRKNAKGIRYDK